MPRVLVGAVVLLLALAGCGGDPKADPSTSPSVPSASPISTTPAPPALPEAAKANTKAGAIAFVKYYVGLINHLQRTGDESALRQASAAACKSCAAVVAAANRIYDSGGHVEGGQWTIDQVTAFKPSPQLWAVRTRGSIAPSTVIHGDTSPKETGSGGDADAEFFVSFTDRWKVAQWHTG